MPNALPKPMQMPGFQGSLQPPKPKMPALSKMSSAVLAGMEKGSQGGIGASLWRGAKAGFGAIPMWIKAPAAIGLAGYGMFRGGRALSQSNQRHRDAFTESVEQPQRDRRDNLRSVWAHGAQGQRAPLPPDPNQGMRAPNVRPY